MFGIGETISLALVLGLCFVGFLVGGGLLFLLIKLGVIASYWGKQEPANVGDHTLKQSREAGTTTADSPSSTVDSETSN